MSLEEQLHVIACLAVLTDRERECIWSMYWAGKRECEIARELGVTRQNVAQTLARGRRKLAPGLKEAVFA